MKRPACFQRQTSACRRCGMALRQPSRRHEEPVGATDALRPTGGGRSTESGPSQVSSGRSDPLQLAGRVSSGRSDPLQALDGCPAGEAIHSNSPDRCPAGEGPTSNSNRRTGPRTKDQRQLRRFDPRCLQRTNVNSASAAIPSWETIQESESSSGRTRATGITHPGFLWSETLEKA